MSLSHTLSEFTLGVIVTFAAYLLGVITESLYGNKLTRYFQQPRRRELPIEPDYLITEQAFELLASDTGHRSAYNLRFASLVSFRGYVALQRVSKRRILEAERSIRRLGLDVKDIAIELGVFRMSGSAVSISDESWTELSLSDEAWMLFREAVRDMSSTTLRDSVIQIVTTETVENMDLVAKRLAGERPELYSEYDRLESEAEFRLHLLVPFLFLIIVLACIWNPIVLISLAGLPLLAIQGLRKWKAAGDFLVGSIVSGRVDAPTLERVTLAAQDLAADNT